jgi:flagellum-specific ATP synthase
MHSIVPQTTLGAVRRFKQLYARHQRSRDLVSVGAYVPGTDPLLDQALAVYPRMESFLQQNLNESATLAASVAGLGQLFPQPDQPSENAK